MTNDKPQLDWCCDELQEATAVSPSGWDWRSVEVWDGTLQLVRVQPDTGGAITGTLEGVYSSDHDFTFRYCPFCGADVTGIVEPEQ